MKKTLVILMVAAMTIFGFACRSEENTNITDTAATDTSMTMLVFSSLRQANPKIVIAATMRITKVFFIGFPLLLNAC